MGSGRKSYGNILRTGTSKDKQFNYICPKYWDISRNISLDPESALWDKSEIIDKSIKKTLRFIGYLVLFINEIEIKILNRIKSKILVALVDSLSSLNGIG